MCRSRRIFTRYCCRSRRSLFLHDTGLTHSRSNARKIKREMNSFIITCIIEREKIKLKTHTFVRNLHFRESFLAVITIAIEFCTDTLDLVCTALYIVYVGARCNSFLRFFAESSHKTITTTCLAKSCEVSKKKGESGHV